jgi:hypothetical protein
MTRPKKDIGWKGATSDPVNRNKKRSNTGQTISGHPKVMVEADKVMPGMNTLQKQAEVSDSLNVRMSRI